MSVIYVFSVYTLHTEPATYLLDIIIKTAKFLHRCISGLIKSASVNETSTATKTVRDPHIRVVFETYLCGH